MKVKTKDPMKCLSVCYFILTLFAVGFIACGDSEDEDVEQPTKETTPNQSSTGGTEVTPAVVDFAAEEAAIRDVFESHTAAWKAKDTDKVMQHWLKRETPEVFMAQKIGGLVSLIEKWSGIKNSLAPTWKLFGGGGPTPTVITLVGIDARGQNATCRGEYDWGGAGKLSAAFKKDKDGWKIRAMDFGDHKLIKEIQTPR